MNKEQFKNIKAGDVLYNPITPFGSATINEYVVELVLKDDYGFHKIFVRAANGKIEELSNTEYTRKNWHVTKQDAIRRAIHVSKGLRGFYAEQLLRGNTPSEECKKRMDFYDAYIYLLKKQEACNE